MLVLGRESSSWDEMGMCCDNVQPENIELKSRTRTQSRTVVQTSL